MQVEVLDPTTCNPASNRHSERMIENLPTYPCAKLKLDQFFLQWLSENQDIVSTLVDDIQAGRPLRNPGGTCQTLSPFSPLSANAIFSSTPPLSPSKSRSPSTPLSPHRRSLTTSSNLKKPSPISLLPQFYFPARTAAPANPSESEVQRKAEVHLNGRVAFGQRDFVEFLQESYDVPSMVGFTLFRRLAGSDEGSVSSAVLSAFWTSRQLETASPIQRVFECLRNEGNEGDDANAKDDNSEMDVKSSNSNKKDNNNKNSDEFDNKTKDLILSLLFKRRVTPTIGFDDLCLLMEQVLAQHPGLAFLQETAEFQRKYAETVIYRIFYSLSKSGSSRLTLRDLRKSDFLEALYALDREDDINKVLKYFSYEHFYVIYCKFWELDTDHDFLISRDDLAHYGQCSLSFRIIERIFELQSSRPVANAVAGKMNYEEFIWFILSEEDKATEPALEYWFACIDLDGDGVLRSSELWYFYQEQQQRLETTHHEVVQFGDLVCQLHDMLNPKKEGHYTLADLKRTKRQSGLLFNALFNLPKFVGFENRDPFQVRAEATEFAGLTDWEKFAKIEYFRLASEDDQDDGGGIEAEDSGMWGADTPMTDMR
mmetsp:Transcript_6958/g.13678  ORF Transcript_6958/g.13678 Transcript_6958/m.13678 type:complete len:597 (-) Transcript_6958:691-2481(-)